jgi:hypothetical protein
MTSRVLLPYFPKIRAPFWAAVRELVIITEHSRAHRLLVAYQRAPAIDQTRAACRTNALGEEDLTAIWAAQRDQSFATSVANEADFDLDSKEFEAEWKRFRLAGSGWCPSFQMLEHNFD